jgi:alpha-methylacyl-CoA racemase
MCERIAAIVASRTLPEWQGAIDDPDACLSPVLSLDEAAHHPHIAARQTLRFEGDAVIAGAAPRFLPGPGGAPPPARSISEAIAAWPVSDDLLALLAEGAESQR